MWWRINKRANGRKAWNVFYPEGEINKIKPKRSSVVCYCCKGFGLVQRFTVKEIANLLKKKHARI